MQKSIILATDNNYLIQAETTIKSILTHNTDVCIYVFNNDIAPEWFKLLNVKLASANSQIINIRVDKNMFTSYKTGETINYTTFFQYNWKEIDSTYNYLVGLDYNYRAAELSRLENSLPKIVHFAGIHKPWYTYSSTRLRELWWTYRDLDWLEVLSKFPHLNYYKRVNQSKKQIFILTLAAEIEHIHYLITSLSDWHFHLAAPCFCSEPLTSLSQYSNVTVYQNILHSRIDWLLDDSTVYLDINHYVETMDILSRAKERNKKIFAFDTTRKSQDDSLYDGIFSINNPEQMVEAIKKL